MGSRPDLTGAGRGRRRVPRADKPHHRELQVHCYRVLGSFQDAEDAVQDTLLAAWQGFGGFEGRASPHWGPCMQISGPQPVIVAGHSAAVCSTPGLPAFPDRPCGDAQSYKGIDGPPGRATGR